MQRIYIAGHRGMVGSAIVGRLEARREQGESLELITRTHAELELPAVEAFGAKQFAEFVVLTGVGSGDYSELEFR